MLPAGTLLHLIPIGGLMADKTSKFSSKTQYIIKNVEVEDDGKLNEIMISSKMVTDHMPLKYVKSLRFCNETCLRIGSLHCPQETPIWRIRKLDSTASRTP